MNKNLSEITPVLSQYHIKPNHIEQYGKVLKIYSHTGSFALKKIDAQHGMDFIRHVLTLYQRGYNRIVPIYPTMDHRFAVLEGNSIYYLMPWLDNLEKEGRFDKHQELFRELARLHFISVQEMEVDQDVRKGFYEKTIEQWEKEQVFMEEYIEKCEHEWYMSPFQLLFCTFYQDTTQALKYAREKLEQWDEEAKKLKKVRTVMIHGKVSLEHFLYDQRGYGYFTNFEDARQASPIHDLLPFLSRALNTYPRRSEDCLGWLETYFKYFPLKDDEMTLFKSYLAHPGAICRLVEEYFLNRNERKNELKYVRKLQHQYWQLKNTEYIIMKLEEKERNTKNSVVEELD